MNVFLLKKKRKKRNAPIQYYEDNISDDDDDDEDGNNAPAPKKSKKVAYNSAKSAGVSMIDAIYAVATTNPQLELQLQLFAIRSKCSEVPASIEHN